MKLRTLFITTVILLFVVNSFAQQRTIKGVVTTFDSIAVIGADIKIKSTKEVVKTDSLGQFLALIDQSDKLTVSAGGFYKQKVDITKQIKFVAINIKLKPTEKAREYAIGYGYVNDAEKLNALSQISSDDLDFSMYTNMYELIRGRVPGVQVHTNGDIVMRGVNSFYASPAALIVVDGVPVDKSVFATLVPANVKSISTIKDGSAAIYGSRGANGVVIVETKKGTDN